MAAYIQIGDNINNDVLIEVPSEKDGTLLLSSVAAQYPGSVGLKFKSETGAWRGCRVEGNIVDAPVDGWGTRSYYVVRQAQKRSATSQSGAPNEKQTREDEDGSNNPFLEKYHIPDLMMADLPFSADDDEIKEYFECFGSLESFKIAKNENGRSRGFGFLKFKTTKGTKAALEAAHFIHSRPVELRYTKQSLQMLQMGYGLECMPNDNIATKLFCGRLPLGTTSGELTETFKKYGPLKDVYIPPHAKGYGFVTFGSVAMAFRAMNDTHMVHGQYINVTTSNSKPKGQKDGEGNDSNSGTNKNMMNNMNMMNMMGGMGNMGHMMGNMGNMMGMNPKQSRINGLANALLEGMNQMSQQVGGNSKYNQFGNTTNNTGFSYNTGNGSGFQGAYGGAPGAGAVAGAMALSGMGYGGNNRGKKM